jgi:hypothetical protein
MILPVAMVVVAGCGGSPANPNSPGTPGASTSTLTATIDGVAFVGKTVTATYHEGTDSSSLLVNAVDASNNLLGFDIAPPLKTAFSATTYPLSSNGSNATYNPLGMTGWTGFTGAQTGSVIVTGFSKTSKTATGTFSFVLHNSASAKTITNGTFSVTFDQTSAEVIR